MNVMTIREAFEEWQKEVDTCNAIDEDILYFQNKVWTSLAIPVDYITLTLTITYVESHADRYDRAMSIIKG